MGQLYPQDDPKEYVLGIGHAEADKLLKGKYHGRLPHRTIPVIRENKKEYSSPVMCSPKESDPEWLKIKARLNADYQMAVKEQEEKQEALREIDNLFREGIEKKFIENQSGNEFPD